MPMVGLGRCNCNCGPPTPPCVEPAAPKFLVQTNVDTLNHYLLVGVNVPCTSDRIECILWGDGAGVYNRDIASTADVPVQVEAEPTGINTDFGDCLEYTVRIVRVGDVTYEYLLDRHAGITCGTCINLEVDGDYYTRRRFRVGDQPDDIEITMDATNDPLCFPSLTGTGNVSSFTQIDGWIVAGSYTYAAGGPSDPSITVSWRNYRSCQCSLIAPERCAPGTLHEFPFAFGATYGGSAGIPFRSWEWSNPDTPFEMDHKAHEGNGTPAGFCCERPSVPLSGVCTYEMTFGPL